MMIKKRVLKQKLYFYHFKNDKMEGKKKGERWDTYAFLVLSVRF